MKRIRDVSIRGKVLISPSILIMALVLTAGLGSYGLNAMHIALVTVDAIALQKIATIDEFALVSEQVRSNVFFIAVQRIMELPEEDSRDLRGEMEQGISDLHVIYGEMTTQWALDDTERAILERLKLPMNDFTQQARQAVAVVSSNPSFGVLLVYSADTSFADFQKVLTELLGYQRKAIAVAEESAIQNALLTRTGIFIIVALLTAVGIGGTLLISSRHIAHPIRSMTGTMARLASGDLTGEIPDVDRGDEIGAMAHAVEVFRDNAIEKANLDRALQASELRLRNIVEYSSNLFYQHTPQHIVTYVSPQTREILDCEPEDALVHWTEFTTDHPINEIGLRITEETIRTGRTHEPYELEMQGRAGRKVWVEVREAAVVQDGTTVAIVGSLTDITKRKQAETELHSYMARLEEIVAERTQALKAAQEDLVRQERLAALGQLAGSVGHELRNPLGVISNALYLIRMLLAESDVKVLENLDIIGSAVSRADKIIADLLDFGRIRIPDRHSTDVTAMVAEALSQTPPPQTISVESHIPGDLPNAYVSSRQIEQVLTNLLTNAYQAMPQGGQVAISAETGERHITLSVTDTGQGISEKNLEKLFTPLFTTKVRGIGLGLAISRNLLEANGGEIIVESKEGVGSTFTLRLPIAGLSDPAERLQ